MQVELFRLSGTSRHSASFALPPLDLSSPFFFGLARVRKQEVRNLFEFGFVFSSSSSFFRDHQLMSTGWAFLAVVENSKGVGGLRAEMVKGVGASFETGIVELFILDRGKASTGFGRVVGGCEDFLADLQLFREAAFILE